MIVFADQTLQADSPTFDLNPPFNFGNTPRVQIIAFMRTSAGESTFHYDHIYMQFNGDSTVNDYGWSVNNSDNTHAISVPGSSTHNTETTDILIGHGPAPSAVAPNIFGQFDLTLYNPGVSGLVKNVHIQHTLMTDFTSYADVNPIETRGGGFWVGPGPITRITFFPLVANIAAGSRVIVRTPY